jgi:hypothetical protein
MAEAGCIYFGPTGWMATEHGCAVLERERAKARDDKDMPLETLVRAKAARSVGK